MPFRNDIYTENVMQRYNSVEELTNAGNQLFGTNNDQSLDDAELMRANSGADIWHKLGIKVNEDGTVPARGENPGFFLIKKGEDKQDHVYTLAEQGIKAGSLEFWREAQMGNLFAYPAGDVDPVQIQVKLVPGDTPHVKYSKPLKHEKLPFAKPPKVEKPNFFKRMFRRLNKNWGDEYNRYIQQTKELEKYNLNKNNNLSYLELNNGPARMKGLSGEVETVKAQYQEEERIRKQKENQEAIKQAEAEEKRIDNAMENMKSVYNPVPTMREGMHQNTDPKKGKVVTNAYFNDKAHFDALKKYKGVTLNMYKLGNGKDASAMTEDHFSALAYFAAQDPEHFMKGAEKRKQYHKSVIPAMEDAGYSKKDAQNIACSSCSMVSADLFHNPPRENSGATIAPTVNSAKEKVIEAMKAYKGGDKKPMAALVANGIKRASEFAAVSVSTGDEYFGTAATASQIVDIMEKDPDLEKMVLDQKLVKKRDIDTIKGMRRHYQLDKDRRAAMKELKTAAINGDELGDVKKKELTQKILKANLVDAMYSQYTNDGLGVTKAETDKQVELTGRMQFMTAEMKEQLRTNPNYVVPDPEKGKFWDLHSSQVLSGVSNIMRTKPPVIRSLSKDNTDITLNNVVNGIYIQNKLAGKSTQDLAKMLDVQGELRGDGLAVNSKKVMDTLGVDLNKEEPEVEIGLNNNKPNITKNQQEPVLGGNH